MNDHDHERGWESLPIAELCDAQIGLVTGPRDFRDTGVPVVRAADIVGHRLTGAPRRHVALDERPDWARYTLEAGDVLLTRSGTVGRIALVTEAEAGWLNGPHLIRLRVRAHPVLAPEYLAAYLSASSAQGWLRRVATGSAVQHVSLKMLGELPVPLPPLAEQHHIGRTLAALDDKARAHEEVARATRALRETMADLLTSGAAPPDDGIAFFR
ncbi:restriction endonuclease subunit S [Streptomyces sp. NPDC006339]|uniref:restriction endonuclease subunit S n=1 Tax=Streptomyces sp. NPDC006339 TaxID=3156755 RepID=UPI0033B86897